MTSRGSLVGLAQLVSIALISVVGGLVFWAAVPIVLGWSAHAVLSGSMAPQVAVGDVLTSEPVEAATLKPGMVVLFHDPDDPAIVLAHRIRAINDDGGIVTRGDANTADDPSTVGADDVVGLARLRVPWIGMPRVWFGEGNYLPLVLTVGVLTGAAVVATRPDPVTD